MTDSPRPPAGLKAPGRRLWVEVLSRYVLSPAELLILEQSARTADELTRLERAVRALDDLVVVGSTGQPEAHPLLEETRRHRVLLGRLTGSLNLPDELHEAGLRGPSRHAQEAARARWRGERPTVAIHRRPVDMVPLELRRYVRTQWERPGDEGWWPAFQRWKDARAAWLEQHPGSEALGNKLERMRIEYQAQFTPEHYPPDAAK